MRKLILIMGKNSREMMGKTLKIESIIQNQMMKGAKFEILK